MSCSLLSAAKCLLDCRFFYFWLIMFLIHQMSVGMFRLMGAIGRTIVIATTMGSTLVLFIVTLSGFVLAYSQVISDAFHLKILLGSSKAFHIMKWTSCAATVC